MSNQAYRDKKVTTTETPALTTTIDRQQHSQYHLVCDIDTQQADNKRAKAIRALLGIPEPTEIESKDKVLKGALIIFIYGAPFSGRYYSVENRKILNQLQLSAENYNSAENARTELETCERFLAWIVGNAELRNYIELLGGRVRTLGNRTKSIPLKDGVPNHLVVFPQANLELARSAVVHGAICHDTPESFLETIKFELDQLRLLESAPQAASASSQDIENRLTLAEGSPKEPPSMLQHPSPPPNVNYIRPLPTPSASDSDSSDSESFTPIQNTRPSASRSSAPAPVIAPSSSNLPAGSDSTETDFSETAIAIREELEYLGYPRHTSPGWGIPPEGIEEVLHQK